VDWLILCIYYTHIHLTALWLGLLQKGKNNLDFTEARDSEWQWYQLDHMQVCIVLQTDNHASTPPLSFYRPDAFPATQPTASKALRHCSGWHVQCEQVHQMEPQFSKFKRKLSKFGSSMDINCLLLGKIWLRKAKILLITFGGLLFFTHPVYWSSLCTWLGTVYIK